MLRLKCGSRKSSFIWCQIPCERKWVLDKKRIWPNMKRPRFLEDSPGKTSSFQDSRKVLVFSSTAIFLALPCFFPHHFRDFIFVSTVSFHSVFDKIVVELCQCLDWNLFIKKDLYYMSCYYLCLDWNLFSINYLEDLHKLLPSQSSSFRDNNDPESCK